MKSSCYILLLFLLLHCAGGHWVIKEKESEAEVVIAKKITAKEENLKPQNIADKIADARPGDRIKLDREPVTIDNATTTQESTTEFLRKAEASRQRAKKSGSKPLPVTYSGDEFIREVLPGKSVKEGTVVTIKGNASIKRGTMTLNANTIKIFGEDAAYARASGNLRIGDQNSHSRLDARLAEFYKLENKIVISGAPVLEQKNARTGDRTFLRCREMERLLDRQLVICHGDISLTNREGSVFAGQAVYDEKKQTIELTQQPRAFSGDNILLGEKIIYYHTTGNIEVINEVRLFLTDAANKKDSIATVTTVIDADYALAERGEAVYLRQKITLTGNRVKVSRSDANAWAAKIEVWGSGGEEILATDRVELVNHSDGSLVTGENLRFFKIAGIAIMKTAEKDGKKIRPQAIFHNKQGQPSGIVNAETLERNALLNRSQARGNVEMTIPRESGNILIRGEWADIDEQKQLVTVRGNPYLDDSAGKIHARQILLFAAEKRFELIGPIQGAMGERSAQ